MGEFVLKEKNSNRIVYLDILRIIATFSVVVLHVSGQIWGNLEVDSFNWSVVNFFDSLVRWTVPVFVMISGVLFLGKSISAKTMITKYTLRIITAFVFWSAVYAIYEFFGGKTLKQAGINFLKGHYHMWFLFMIIGLYLVVPILQKVVKNKQTAHYFLMLSLLFAFMIPQAIKVINLFNESVGDILNNAVSKSYIFLPLGFSGFFVLGYVFNQIVITKRIEIASYSLGIIGMVSTITLTWIISTKNNVANDLFYDSFTVNVLLQCIGVFVFAKQYLSFRNLSQKSISKIQKLSKYSFGVYLVHALIIEIFQDYFHITSLSFSPIISIPVISIVVFIVSYAISTLLNMIPIVKKYIV